MWGTASYCLAYTQRQPNSLPLSLGSYHFLRKAVPNLLKVSINKILTPPILAKKILWPPTIDTPYPQTQAKLVLNSVFLNKINTLSVVIFWLPTFWSSKMLWPPYFSFQKFTTPWYIWDPTLPKKMIVPLISQFLFTHIQQGTHLPDKHLLFWSRKNGWSKSFMLIRLVK